MHPIDISRYDTNNTIEEDIFLVIGPEIIEPMVKHAAQIA